MSLVFCVGRGVVAHSGEAVNQWGNVRVLLHGNQRLYVGQEDLRPATPANLAAYLPDERARGLECKQIDCWCREFNPIANGA